MPNPAPLARCTRRATPPADFSRERLVLWSRLQRRYALTLESFEVAGTWMEILRPSSTSLDQAWSREPLAGAYWAELWDGGVALADWLARRGSLSGQRVLDLGCGLGVIGAMAARQGAAVWLADAANDALLFARWNCWPWRRRVRCRRLDWTGDRLSMRFDWILTGDVLYDPQLWDGLERFCRVHLADGGAWLVGEPGPLRGGKCPSWLAERGWCVETHAAQRAALWTPLTESIRIIQVRRPIASGENRV